MHSSIRSTTTIVKDQPSPTQWVEIIEPKSKEKMYANLQTGSCVWDAPEVRKLTKLILRLIKKKPEVEIISMRSSSSSPQLINLRGGFSSFSVFQQLTRNIIVNIALQKNAIEENENN